jgi:hypothetical protein
MEMRLRDNSRYFDVGLYLHPGVPFYLVSWLCLRIVTFLTGHRDAVVYVLEDPEAFFLSTRIAAIFITAAAVAGAWRILNPLPASKRALAIISFFAADPWSLVYGLTFLSTETFALPLATLLFWSVDMVLGASMAKRLPWAFVGFVAALGYLVKLPYLDIMAGAIALVIARSVRFSAPVSSRFAFAATRLSLVLGVFFAVVVGVLLIFIGWTGIVALAEIQFVITMQPVDSGEARSQIVSFQAMHNALALLASSSPLPFMVVIVTGASGYFLYRGWRCGTLEDREILWLSTALAALGFIVLAVLNHLHFHYLPAVAAIFPFLWGTVLEKASLARVAVLCISASAMFTGWNATGLFSALSRMSAGIQADEPKIAALPLNNGEARLWTYLVPSRYFAKEFILQNAGVPSLMAPPEHARRTDFSSYERVLRPYRYVILDRFSHPDSAAVLRLAANGQLREPNGMKLEIGEGAVVRELNVTIVIETPGRTTN